MPVRGWCSGFYAGGRPVDGAPLPDYSASCHGLAGAFFDSREPDFTTYWHKAAEIRYLAAVAMRSGLSPDTAPEHLLLLEEDDQHRLIADIEYRQAEATLACLTSQ